jgi:hypothetical protein
LIFLVHKSIDLTCHHLTSLIESASQDNKIIPTALLQLVKEKFAFLNDSITPALIARVFDPRFHELGGISKSVVKSTEKNILRTLEALNPYIPIEILPGYLKAMHAEMHKFNTKYANESWLSESQVRQ